MPTPLTANLGSQVHDLVIPPLQSRSIEQPGVYFYVVTAPCRINIKWNKGVYNPYVQGSSDDTERAGPFERLEVFNPTTAEIRVEIYVGWTKYSETRSTSIPPRSRIQAADTTTIPALGRVNFPTKFDAGDIQRAAFVMTNRDTTLYLEIHDPSGKPFLQVGPRDSVTVPISEGLSVYNPNGAAVSAFMGEIIYTLKTA